MSPPPLKLRWTGLVLAYARERLATRRVLLAVMLVLTAVLAGGGWRGRGAFTTDLVLALALVVTFRMYDDLIDLVRDRKAHPHRVTVRARSIAPLRIASIVLGTGTLVGLDAGRPGAVALLIVYTLVLAASYALRGGRTAVAERILLLKYGVFTLAVIGFPEALTPRALVAGLSAFAIACVYEWWHDAESPVFSFGGSR